MSLRKKPTLKNRKVKIGITLGDPSGIGPEIAAKAIAQVSDLADFTVIGDSWVFDQSQESRVNPSTSLRIDGEPFDALRLLRANGELVEPERSRTIKSQGFKFIDLANVNRKNFQFGKVKAEYGRASIEYLDKALGLLRDKKLDCLVTCPISKEAVGLAGIACCGHTGYLSQKSGAKNTVMMLLNKYLKIALVTQHIPLKTVSSQVTKEKIVSIISLTHKSLKELFFIQNPRIVVCGLNPHASDNGLIGKEENQTLKPALKELKYPVFGPESADVAMAKAINGVYDCVIAMYHDQALIPLKIMGGQSGVNLTLGLPFVRTSPLHGTAFDIAGKNKADASSLIAAIKLAVECRLNQGRKS